MSIRTIKFTLLSLAVSFFLVFSSISSVFAQTNDALQFSGFARVVLGYLDESNATFLGYEDNVSLERQSLIGLHADYKMSDNLSVTGQFVGNSGGQRESGLDWLYLNYEPTRAIQIKLGKQRTPFFNYSDSIDVGFAYPWITLPQQVYSQLFFPTFEGILGNYQWTGKEIGFELEGYWGSYDDGFQSSGVEIDAKVNDIRGLIAKVNYDSWALRASYHTARATLDQPKLKDFANTLNLAGFPKSSSSLDPDGDVNFYQVAANYENLDYFFRAEATRVRAQSSAIPDLNGYFVAVGYNFYPFSAYLSYGRSVSELDSPVSEIPIGVDPRLDGLALGYRNVLNSLYNFNSDSITLGSRWDWKLNLAFKAEVTWTETKDDNNVFFQVSDKTKFDRKAPLYQLAVEWVF